jgi:DNA-binding response OmpR family regulator
VPKRVLIVDDNVGLAENIAEILQLDGYATDVFASAEEASLTPLDVAPDVLVTDYRLPGINGAEFVRRFRQTHARVVAIVMSAYTDDTTMEDAQSAGATFVSKPVDLAILGGLIQAHGVAA